MSTKNVSQVSASPQENPSVIIRYEPANAPIILAQNATKMLARIQTIKGISGTKSLEAASEVLEDAKITAGEVDTFLESLRGAIEKGCARVRELPGFEDFEATLTIRKWGLRSLLQSGITNLRGMRAKFLSDEDEKVRRENLRKQAEQDRINREAADKAAAAARKQGADKETVKEIKQAVMETPAPVVTSKAAEVAKESGASVRYSYSAEITNLKSFLGACLNNSALLATLSKAIPDIEKAFRGMAVDQKELFAYPGITVKKTPIDVGRRA